MPISGGRARNAKPGVAEIVGRLLGGRDFPERLYNVHDMDRDASGLVVFARRRSAADELRESFKRGKFSRLYTAVVVLKSDEAEDVPPASINTLLRPDRRGVSEVVPLGAELERNQDGSGEPASDFAVRAVTHLQPKDRKGRLAIVRFRAETDYPFQVRAHAASLDAPVLGDRPYDAPDGPERRVYLHADELSFSHPVTRQPMRYRVPAPKDFRAVLDSGLPEPRPEDTTDAHRESNTGAQTTRNNQDKGWDDVADWYAEHLASDQSDHQTQVVRPGVHTMLLDAVGTPNRDLEGVNILDVACGEGSLSRELAGLGARVTGLDASASLIETANTLAGTGAVADRLTYDVADARAFTVEPNAFDAATCVLALMNIDDLDATFHSIATALRPGGILTAVILHPAFRDPRRTFWHATTARDGTHIQYRRVDGYLSEARAEIVMNPGAVADGAEPVNTTTYTRPISAYINTLAAAGLLTERLEEWPSHRTSQPGPKADAENTARAEIPLFLALTARKPT